MTRRLTVGGPFVAALALVLLSGCTITTHESAGSTTSGSAPATAAPSATPGPTPEAAQPATCDTVLSSEGYEKLSDDGLEPTSAGTGNTLAQRMIEAGGLECTWGKPQSDIVLTVVHLTVSPGDEATWSDALTAEGFVASDDPVAGAFTGPVGGSGLSPVVVLDDGTLTYLSTPAYGSMLSLSN